MEMSLNFIRRATESHRKVSKQGNDGRDVSFTKITQELYEGWMEGWQGVVRKLQWPGQPRRLWGWSKEESRSMPDTNTCEALSTGLARSRDSQHRAGGPRRRGAGG